MCLAQNVAQSLEDNLRGSQIYVLAQMQSLLFPIIVWELLKGVHHWVPANSLHPIWKGITLRSPFLVLYIPRCSTYQFIFISHWMLDVSSWRALSIFYGHSKQVRLWNLKGGINFTAFQTLVIVLWNLTGASNITMFQSLASMWMEPSAAM